MPVVPLLVFFCRDIASGSLLGRRCCDEEVEATECSDKILSRLEVRLNVVDIGVVIVVGIGICDGRPSESVDKCGEEERSSADPDKSATIDALAFCGVN